MPSEPSGLIMQMDTMRLGTGRIIIIDYLNPLNAVTVDCAPHLLTSHILHLTCYNTGINECFLITNRMISLASKLFSYKEINNF
jgi:hypothetical protein